MNTKKSQLQIGEIVAVLVVFFIIVLIGFVVYFSILRGELEERTEEAKDIGSVGIVQAVLSMPELQCSDNNAVKEKCVDFLKVQVFKDSQEDFKASYFDILGFSEIKVKQIYPSTSPSEWTIYDNKLADSGSKLRTEVPILIHDPLERKNNFGVLSIDTYSR